MSLDLFIYPSTCQSAFVIIYLPSVLLNYTGIWCFAAKRTFVLFKLASVFLAFPQLWLHLFLNNKYSPDRLLFPHRWEKNKNAYNGKKCSNMKIFLTALTNESIWPFKCYTQSYQSSYTDDYWVLKLAWLHAKTS